jgi:hypothetical protein
MAYSKREHSYHFQIVICDNKYHKDVVFQLIVTEYSLNLNKTDAAVNRQSRWQYKGKIVDGLRLRV